MTLKNTPHSGYHRQTPSNRFFEGWYFRLTLPDLALTFAFMYSIDDPAGGTDHSGGAAQILGGPHDTYYCRTLPNVRNFWAWPHQLGLGHWRQATGSKAKALPPKDFSAIVQEGYQVSTHDGIQHHQGRLLLPSGKVQAEWQYQVIPVEGWGGARQKATAGWLSYLSLFEPGWQVLMAHGLASGWIRWRDQTEGLNAPLVRYSFDKVPAYAEKNWGGAFPAKWFWIQCNAFTDQPSLSITAVGGVRELRLLNQPVLTEDVGLIGIHYQGQFYEFLSFQSTAFAWEVEPWGYWQMEAKNDFYRVTLTGRTTDPGTWVRVPTQGGLKFICRDTTHGKLQVQLWQRSGASETLVLSATSSLAGLETGGSPWRDRWSRA